MVFIVYFSSVHFNYKIIIPSLEIEGAKKTFRSMDEIKKDLEKNMGWNVKSDVQIMQDILKQLKAKNSSIQEKSQALDSLEDYVHQVDNGKDFEKIGGLKEVVDLLNSSSEVLQEKAANLIGAATQRYVILSEINILFLCCFMINMHLILLNKI